MSKDDIIRMVREAGLHLATDVNWMPIIPRTYAEKFANLVAEREREACAELCESHVRYPSRLHFAAAIRARGTT